MMRPT